MKLTKFTYNHVIANRVVKYEKENNFAIKIIWERELRIDIPIHKWKKLNTKIYYITKLKFFKYRMINKYITTNARRSKWAETVFHLFWECTKDQRMWTGLTRCSDTFLKCKLLYLHLWYFCSGMMLMNMY